MPHRVAVAAATVAAVTALASLTACGPSTPTSPATASPTTSRLAESPTTGSPAAATLGTTYGARIGALDTLLVYCIPGLPGSPRAYCGLGPMGQAVTQLTTSLRHDVAASPAAYPGVGTVLDAVDAAVAELKPCDAWYQAGGQSTDPTINVSCDQGWQDLTDSFHALEKSLHWP